MLKNPGLPPRGTPNPMHRAMASPDVKVLKGRAYSRLYPLCPSTLGKNTSEAQDKKDQVELQSVKEIGLKETGKQGKQDC